MVSVVVDYMRAFFRSGVTACVCPALRELPEPELEVCSGEFMIAKVFDRIVDFIFIKKDFAPGGGAWGVAAPGRRRLGSGGAWGWQRRPRLAAAPEKARAAGELPPATSGSGPPSPL
jgi:hypothetical protein